MKNKISFCTVSMNRLEHLAETLCKNIRDNSSYKNADFILLDYNSKDGLDQYIKKEFSKFIKNGRLTYYQTFTPSFFNRSHSRNLMFKLATGQILVNVDADNFIGPGFAEYVNNSFITNNNTFLTTINTKNYLNNKKDILGRICFLRNDFIAVNGFDESLSGYGFEDYDFINRLSKLGRSRRLIKEDIYLHSISHSDSKRIENEFYNKSLFKMYIRHLSPSRSEFIFLTKNDDALKFVLLDNNAERSFMAIDSKVNRRIRNRYSILEQAHGKYQIQNSLISFTYSSPKLSCEYSIGAYVLEKDQIIYNEVLSKDFSNLIILNYGLITNKMILDNNLLKRKPLVNNGVWGSDIVYKNFDLNTPIQV